MVLDTKFRMRSPDREIQNTSIRIAVVGSKGVGKTALTVRYLTRRFIGDYQSDRDMIYRTTIPFDGKKTIIEILDSSSSQEDTILPREKIIWAEAWVIVYSITSIQSFSFAQKILKNLVTSQLEADSPSSPSPILLLANKKDLDHVRQVSPREGERLAEKYGCRFCEVCASEVDLQVSDSVESLAKCVLQMKEQTSSRVRKLSVSKMINQLMNRSASSTNHNGSVNPLINTNLQCNSIEKVSALSRVHFRERVKRRSCLKNS